MIDPLTLIGTIPTALNTINSLSSLFQQPYTPAKVYQDNSREVFKQGGKLRGHNKYNAPTHQQGGQLVDDQGIPNPQGRNEIEKKESKYTYSNIKNDTYIFTPEDTKKVDNITKKYKKANTSELDKNALELEIQRVENNNEMKKKQQAKKQFKQGGKIKKYNNGGSTGLPTLNELMLNPMQRGYSLPSDKPIQQLPQGTIRPGQYKVPQLPSNGLSPVSSTSPNTLDNKTQQVALKHFSENSTPKVPGSPLKTLDMLRNITLAGDSLNLLRGAEKEDPIMTDYSKARTELDKLESNLNPLKEQVAQSSNQLRSVNRNSSSSYNSFANREAQRVSNLQQTLGNINLQERNLANSIAGQKAQFESGVARDNSQTLRQNRINNQMNAANTRTIKSQVTSDIMSDIDRRSTIENNKNFANATRKEQMSLLSSMYSNFDVKESDIDLLIKESRGETLTEAEKNRKLELIKYRTNE